MGTNFYLKAKTINDISKFNVASFELDNWIFDEDYDAYIIHIAKTSAGWLPLFQSHESITSVQDIKDAYDCGLLIVDEYGEEYDWDKFTQRVLKHNGGVVGGVPRKKYEPPKDIKSPFYDEKMIGCYVPISHFKYGNGIYADDYYRDRDGYEFYRRGEFC